MPDGGGGVAQHGVLDGRVHQVVEGILRDQTAMEAARSNFDTLWQDVGELILPRYANFITQKTPGEQLTHRIFDTTAQIDCERFAAAMESMLTPRTQRWHRLNVRGNALSDSQAVSRYFDDSVDVLFGNRYAPGSNFASASFECYQQLGGPGNAAMEIIDEEGRGIVYRSWDPAELFFTEDVLGRIDTVHRRYKLKAWHLLELSGESRAPHLRWNIPELVRRRWTGSPNEDVTMLRCIKRNRAFDPRRLDIDGMAWRSYDVVASDRILAFEGGYHTRPVAVSRFNVAGAEIYGRGPGTMILPDVKMLQEMYRRYLRSLQLAVEPPLLAYGEAFLRPVSLRGNAMNWGTLDANGRALLQPLDMGAKLDFSVEACDAVRNKIHDAFFIRLFQQLAEEPNMTATEAMLRNQEKAALLAPSMGRQQSEFLGPVIERELDILGRAGALPDPPDELLELAGEGGGVDVVIEYTSPLARLMRTEEGVGIMRTVEIANALAPIDQTVLLALDAQAILREVGEIWGAPAKVFRSREDVAAKAEAMQQEQQQAQLLQAAEAAGGAAESFAKAGQAAAQSVPAVQA